MKTILVIGLGNVGLPTAEHIMKRNVAVEGFDISKKRVNLARNAGIKVINDMSDTNADAIIVCVGTGFETGMPDMKAVYKVAADIRALEKKPLIVSFESTLYPGTTRYLAEQILNNEIEHVFVCPHRWWSEDTEKYGVDVRRVLGAVKEYSEEIGKDFYENILGIPVSLVSTVETAEICKIVENGRRYIDISFAEYIRMICEKHDIDFSELQKAVNTHFAHDMKEARNGINGECLPLAINYLKCMKDSDFITGAMENDREYRIFLKELF